MRGLLVSLLLVLAALTPRQALADRLSPDELARLASGHTVSRSTTLHGPGGSRYVGGVAYTLVDAPPDAVLAMLDDVEAYRRILPRTKSARVVADRGRSRHIELTQGSALFEATYTVRVERDPRTREIAFWLDPQRPHAIRDAWGFFRARPLPGDRGRTLLAYGVVVDVGAGLVRDFFEERVRAAMLRVPDHVRTYVAMRRPR